MPPHNMSLGFVRTVWICRRGHAGIIKLHYTIRLIYESSTFQFYFVHNISLVLFHVWYEMKWRHQNKNTWNFKIKIVYIFSQSVNIRLI